MTSEPKTGQTAPTGSAGKESSLSAGLLNINAVVGSYRITSVIRSGQSNNVYVAVGQDGKEVVVKEYFPRRLARRLPSGRLGVSSDRNKQQFEAGVKGFVHEAIALATIKSALLSQYVTAFRENNTAYLVTALEPGDTLEVWARKRIGLDRWPAEEDLRLIFWLLLNALQVMHDAGFLHLDLKPSNVIMRPDDTPVLIDLGGARKFPQRQRDISVSNYTPGFAAPEQFEERHDLFAPPTDIYGIGTSILYCMTGKVPPIAPERAKFDTVPVLMERCEGRYSETFIEVVMKSVALNIADRHPTVKALQNALQ